MRRASAPPFCCFFVALLILSATVPSRAQHFPGWWLPVDTVTSGPFADHHPSMPHSRAYSGMGDSWVVFDRTTPSESQIAAVKFVGSTSAFDTTVVILASRDLPDLQIKPDIGMLTSYQPEAIRYWRLAAWQCFKHGRWQILCSSLDDSALAWSAPVLLVADSVDNTDVRVNSIADSLFLVTWKRGNVVMGLFKGPSSRSAPETLAVSASDSLQYDVSSFWNATDLVWTTELSGMDALFHRRIIGGPSNSLTEPDTVVLVPDLANPHLGQGWAPLFAYESSVNGRTDVFGIQRRYYETGPYDEPVNISADSLGVDRNAHIFYIPMTTKVDARTSTAYWNTDLTVYEKYLGADSMLVFLTGSLQYGDRDTLRTRGYNRNPAISTNIMQAGGYLRFPVVWESNRTGVSHIYARLIARLSGSAPEPSGVPSSVELYQNYPNPFNPVTRISWYMPQAGTTNLAVYDLLGREVGILVNGRSDAGVREVAFDARGLSSGVYFYRLRVKSETRGEIVRTRAMIVLR